MATVTLCFIADNNCVDTYAPELYLRITLSVRHAL